MSEFRGFKHRPVPIRWPADLLRRIFAPRQEPRVAPGVGMFDAPVTCVRINAQWASHILGALEVLNQDDAWQGDAAEVFRARQEIERLMAAIVEGNCTEVGETLAAQFRINNCIMEYSYDGVTWTPVGGWESFAAACFTGPTGPPGADGDTIDTINVSTISCEEDATALYADGVLTLGIPRGCDGTDGAPGQDGADGQGIDSVTVNTLNCGEDATASLSGGALTLGIPRGCDNSGWSPGYREPSTASDLEHVCGGVINVIDYLFAQANSYLDWLEAYNNAAEVTTYLGTIYAPGLFELVSDTAGLVTSIFETGIAVLRADLNNPDSRDQEICKLYGLVGTNAITGNTFDELIFDAWIAADGGVPRKMLLYKMAENIKFPRLNTRFRIGMESPSTYCAALNCDGSDPGGDPANPLNLRIWPETAEIACVADLGNGEYRYTFLSGTSSPEGYLSIRPPTGGSVQMKNLVNPATDCSLVIGPTVTRMGTGAFPVQNYYTITDGGSPDYVSAWRSEFDSQRFSWSITVREG